MSDLDHRVGVREANLVLRNLRLSNFYDAVSYTNLTLPTKA